MSKKNFLEDRKKLESKLVAAAGFLALVLS